MRVFWKVLAVLAVFCLAQTADCADLSRKVEFKQISAQLETIENNLKNNELSIEQIDEHTSELYALSNELFETKRFNEREAKVVQKQLDALGGLEDGGKELQEISATRNELKNELALLKSRIAETDVLQVKIDDLNLLILNFKSQKVLGNLVDKQEVLLLPQTFFASFKALGVFFLDLVQSPVHWYQRLDESSRSYVLTYFIPFVFILIAAIWLGLVLKHFILKNWGYKDFKETDDVCYFYPGFEYKQFIEEHEWEFIMCMMELEGVLVAVAETLDYLVMLHYHGII